MQATAAAPKVVAGYVRVSTAGQKDNYSPEEQVRRIKDYASEHNMVIPDEYLVHETYTGHGWRERPKLNYLLGLARQGKIEDVVAVEVDRVARGGVAIIEDQFEHYGVPFRFTEQEFEDSAFGRFKKDTYSFMGAFEREAILARTTKGRNARIASGLPMPGKAPYGYSHWAIGQRPEDRKPTRQTLVVDEVEAAVVRRMFEAAAGGMSTRGISLMLHADGITTKLGKRWMPSSVHWTLLNPTFAGLRYTNRFTGKPRRLTPESSWVLSPGAAPAIVSEELYRAVQRTLKENKHLARKTVVNETAILFGGMMTCANCKRSFTLSRSSPRRMWVYRCCHTSPGQGVYVHPYREVNQVKVDTAVWEFVCGLVLEPERVRQELERQQTTDVRLEQLQQLDRTLKRQNELIDNLAAGIASLSAAAQAPLLARLEQTVKQKDELIVERATLTLARDKQHKDEEALFSLGEWCAGLREKLVDLTVEEKRTVLRGLGVHVLISHDDEGWKLDVDTSIGVQLSNTFSTAGQLHNPWTLRWRLSLDGHAA